MVIFIAIIVNMIVSKKKIIRRLFKKKKLFSISVFTEIIKQKRYTYMFIDSYDLI